MSIDAISNRDMVTLMMDFENGDLNEQQTFDFFQQLIDSGSVWQLPGCYGQMASELIRNGYCKPSEDSHQHAYGNTVPSHPGAASSTDAHQVSEFRPRCSTVNRTLFPSIFAKTQGASGATSPAKNSDAITSTTKQRYRVNVESTDYLFADIWAENESDAYQIALNLEPSDLRIMSSGSMWVDSVTVVTEDDESLEPFLPIN